MALMVGMVVKAKAKADKRWGGMERVGGGGGTWRRGRWRRWRWWYGRRWRRRWRCWWRNEGGGGVGEVASVEVAMEEEAREAVEKMVEGAAATAAVV